jgi:hypothetical protein
VVPEDLPAMRRPYPAATVATARHTRDAGFTIWRCGNSPPAAAETGWLATAASSYQPIATLGKEARASSGVGPAASGSRAPSAAQGGREGPDRPNALAHCRTHACAATGS